MRFDYQSSLVEQAVFLAVRRDARLECALHMELDPLYSIPDGEIRDRDSQRVYADNFKRLGLDRLIPKLIAERPAMTHAVAMCFVHEAESARAQSAELFVKRQSGTNGHPTRTLVIRLCAESFLDSAHLDSWLRCELLPVSDMLDPAFGYSAELPTGIPARQTLIRDRYSVLWSMYVEARLLREGRSNGLRIPGLWRSFARAMAQQGLIPPRTTFDALLQVDHVTHGQLLTWASDPASIEVMLRRKADHRMNSTSDEGMYSHSTMHSEPIAPHADGREPYDE